MFYDKLNDTSCSNKDYIYAKLVYKKFDVLY